MLILKILRENKQSFLYIIILLISAIAFSSSLIYLSYKYELLIKSFSFYDWILIFVGLSLAMAFSLTSTTVAALLCGYFLGWPSLIFYILAYLMATIIGNFIAHKIDKGNFLETLKKVESIDKYLTVIDKDQLPLIILARLSPIFPFSIMNVFLAATEFKLDKILIGSLAGMLPRTIISFWIGTQFSQLRSLLSEGLNNNVLEITVILLIIFSLLGLYIYITRLIKKVGKRYF